MKFYGKAENVANQIVEAFKNPNELPTRIAPIFINRKNETLPCAGWSWLNQMAVALHGHTDARGFRQWKEVGRSVKKGEKSFQILVPLIGKAEQENDAGEKETIRFIYGFKSANVFGLSQTEGEELPDPNPELTAWIESLPLIEVAREWGISVATYNGQNSSALGKYRAPQKRGPQNSL